MIGWSQVEIKNGRLTREQGRKGIEKIKESKDKI